MSVLLFTFVSNSMLLLILPLQKADVKQRQNGEESIESKKAMLPW